MRKKIIFALAAVALVVVAGVSYRIYHQRTEEAAAAAKPMGKLQFELRKVDKDTGVVSKPVKVNKLSIVNMDAEAFQVVPDAKAVYRSDAIPEGKYFLLAETSDGYSGKYLLDSTIKNKKAVIYLYPKEMVNAIPKDKLYKNADLNIDPKARKVEISDYYKEFAGIAKNLKTEEPYAIIAVGAKLLAQDDVGEYKAVAYTNSRKNDGQNAVSMLEAYRNTTYIGQYKFDYAFVTNIEIMDVDADLNDEIVVSAKYFKGNEVTDRLYFFRTGRKSFELMKIGDKEFLEYKNPEIYIGDNNVQVISDYQETFGNIKAGNRKLIQNIQWKEDTAAKKKIVAEQKQKEQERKEGTKFQQDSEQNKQNEIIKIPQIAVIKEKMTEYRVPEYISQ